jgi:hypothetical protein
LLQAREKIHRKDLQPPHWTFGSQKLEINPFPERRKDLKQTVTLPYLASQLMKHRSTTNEFSMTITISTTPFTNAISGSSRSPEAEDSVVIDEARVDHDHEIHSTTTTTSTSDRVCVKCHQDWTKCHLCAKYYRRKLFYCVNYLQQFDITKAVAVWKKKK